MHFSDSSIALCHPIHCKMTAFRPQHTFKDLYVHKWGYVFEGAEPYHLECPSNSQVRTAARRDLQRKTLHTAFSSRTESQGQSSMWTQSLLSHRIDHLVILLSMRIIHTGITFCSFVLSNHTHYTHASSCYHNLFQKVTITLRIQYKCLYTLYMHFKIGNHC